jgi:antirestriction protein ArdC
MPTDVRTQAALRDHADTPIIARSDDHTTAQQTSRGSVAAQVSAQIVEALRRGVRPWQQPWSNAAALSLPLRATGTAYRGINILVLWIVAQQRGYRSRQWMSFAQARELGGHVRKGEKATRVVYFSPGARGDDEAATTEPHPTRRAFAKSFAVFNVEQIDDLPADCYGPPPVCAEPDDARLAALFARVQATVRVGGARACYDPAGDVIYMPPRDAFRSTAQYYATLAHELGHWTGHASRLDRQLTGARDTASYAAEELVAELCSAFLGAELGLPVDHLEDHAAYIDHWLKILDRDPGALLAAAAKAQAAADYLRALLLESPEAGA